MGCGGGGVTKQPYVLENEDGTMGNADYVYLFFSEEVAQKYADKYPTLNWKLRRLGSEFTDGKK
jgi:hypothetical protein